MERGWGIYFCKMKLYLIGNGFDIAHDLPSCYKCFCEFMRNHHPNDYERMGRWFDNNPAQLWSDYENMLAKLKIEFLVERNVDTWVKLENYQIENAFDTEFSGLKSHFHEWVLATLTGLKTSNVFDLKPTDLYITFNYTNTLETVYGIGRHRILYIHGDTVNNVVMQPVVGHGVSEDEIEKEVDQCRPRIEKLVQEAVERQKVNVSWWEKSDEICNELKTFLKGLRKDVEEIMSLESDFFDKIGERKDEITDVVILGHSLADVDAPYFKKIAGLLNTNTRWHTDYFPHTEVALKIKQERFLTMMGFEVEPYN